MCSDKDKTEKNEDSLVSDKSFGAALLAMPQDDGTFERGVVDDTLILSERDSLRVMDLLDHPPEPTPRLRRAAASLPPEGER